jgi:hypothetical protein
MGMVVVAVVVVTGRGRPDLAMAVTARVVVVEGMAKAAAMDRVVEEGMAKAAVTVRVVATVAAATTSMPGREGHRQEGVTKSLGSTLAVYDFQAS